MTFQCKVLNQKADISCVNKSGHLHVLTTEASSTEASSTDISVRVNIQSTSSPHLRDESSGHKKRSLTTLTSDDDLGNFLHYHPAAYWCPTCHQFTVDCGSLVEPLNAPTVILSNWLIQSVTYDGAQRILELEMNTGERFQHFSVPRRITIALVQADDCAKYMMD
jgi:KTSC domain